VLRKRLLMGRIWSVPSSAA